MRTINLSFTNNFKKNNNYKKNNKENKEKIQLTYHDCINYVPEYFSYMNDNNEEVKFNDKSYMITKISSSKYIAKKTVNSKIPLSYVNAKEEIKFTPAYFTYNGNNYLDSNVIYDKETNSYKGIIEEVNVYDTEIKLYEE